MLVFQVVLSGKLKKILLLDYVKKIENFFFKKKNDINNDGVYIYIYIYSDETYGFKYWGGGGAFPHGVLGVIDSFVLASFSMQGTEIIGITVSSINIILFTCGEAFPPYIKKYVLI